MGKESFASCRDGSTHVFNVLPLPGGTLGSPTALHAKRFGQRWQKERKTNAPNVLSVVSYGSATLRCGLTQRLQQSLDGGKRGKLLLPRLTSRPWFCPRRHTSASHRKQFLRTLPMMMVVQSMRRVQRRLFAAFPSHFPPC